jgi:C4-dicarboxylate transporter DctM subunit
MLLMVINLLFFVALMFFTPIAALVVLVPLVFEIAMSYGIDPIHLGVLIVLNTALGSATPPCGVDIFTAVAIFDVPFTKVARGVPPFVLLGVLVLILLTLFPEISLFIPKLSLN